MKRLATLVVCMLALGAACSQKSSAPAATVNGTKISTQELVDELDAIGGNADYLSSLQSRFTAGGLSVTGSTPGSYDAAFVSQVLRQQIFYSLVHAEFVKRNIQVDDACRLRARNEVTLQLGAKNADAGEKTLSSFSKSYQDLLVRRNTELLALELSLVDSQCGHEAETYFKSHPDDFLTLCASLIVVADQAAADDVVAKARAGADFAALARQVSTDPSSAAGGDVGCVFTGNLSETFAESVKASKVGDILGPLPGQSAFSIIKVNDLRAGSAADASAQADELASVAAERAFTSWLQQAQADAKVDVDKRYGTFDPATFQVNPPAVDLDSNSSGPTPPSSDTP